MAARQGDIRTYLTLAEEMEERWPHYAAVLGTRKRALSGIAPIIFDDGDEKPDAKIAQAVEELIEDPSFPDLVEDLLDGVAKGYSVVEIIWHEKGGKFWPREYLWRDPRWFVFDTVSRTQLRLAELGTIDGVELPPSKFIQHLPRLKAGLPVRAGLAYAAAWLFLLANYTLKDWMAFMDVYGMPLRVGKYHPNATESEKRTLLRAVASIASDASAIIPESMAIEFVEAKAGSQVPFEQASRFFNEQISKLVLGQTMTSDNGSSLGQAKIHNEIRLEILEADARQLAKTINRDLIAWFVAYNFGQGAKAPRIEFPVPKPEDVKTLSAALGALVPLGLEVDQDEIRHKLGLSAPAKGAKLLKAAAGVKPLSDPSALKTGPSLARAHGLGCQCGGCVQLARASDAPDEIDTLADDGASDWEPQVLPMLEQIIAAVKAAGSYEEALKALDALQGSLDTGGLEKALSPELLKAFVLGQLTRPV